MRGSSSSLRISDSCRFNRFLRTALCLCFGTIKPTLGCNTGEVESKTSKWAVLLLFPRCISARISGPVVIRRARGNLRLGLSSPRVASATGPALLAADGDAEALATLLATRIQNGAAALGCHPSAEPVLVLALSIVRIVCRLAHVSVCSVLVTKTDSIACYVGSDHPCQSSPPILRSLFG